MGALNGTRRSSRSIVLKTAAPGSPLREELKKAEKVEKSQDSIEIKNLSFEQRLSMVRQQHEATDYSGMTDAERLRTIDERFEAAFPNFFGLTSGILGGWMPENTRPYDQMVGAYYDQVSEVIEPQPYGSGNLFRKAHFDGMTDDEIRKAVNEKYTGGSMMDRAGAIHELRQAGILDGTGETMIRTMYCQLRDATWSPWRLNLETTHPVRMDAMFHIASDTGMNWTRLTKSTMVRVSQGSHQIAGMTESEAAAKHLRELEEKLSEFLEQMLKK